MTQILIFGASTTWGAWDVKGGWAERLKVAMMEKDILVYNCGVSGDTTGDLLERFEPETRARMDEDLIFIFSIGTNDSCYKEITPDAFENNIKELIKKARKYSKKIVFVGVNSVDEKLTCPVPWNTEAFYRNDKIKKYDNIIREICRKEKILFIEMFGKLTKKDFEDGLHPNTAGHKKMFNIIYKNLKAGKLIK